MRLNVEALTVAQLRLLAHLITSTDRLSLDQPSHFVVTQSARGNWSVHHPVMPGTHVSIHADDLARLHEQQFVSIGFEPAGEAVARVMEQGMGVREQLFHALQREAAAVA